MVITDVKTAVEAAKNKAISNHTTEKFCVYHPNTPSVGSFVHREPGFTEYDPCCNICIGTFVNGQKKFFTKLLEDPSSGGTMVCEVCDTNQDKYVRTDAGIEGNLHVYKDPEDGSWTDMCTSCYKARKASDQKYYEEERDQGYDDE